MRSDDIETSAEILDDTVYIRGWAFEGNDNLVMYTKAHKINLERAKDNPAVVGEKIIEIHERMENELDK